MRLLDHAVAFGHRLPGWLRGSYYGALLLGGMSVIRAFVLLTVVRQPLPSTTQLLAAWAVAILGGMMAGGVWTAANQWLLTLPVVGPYVTGIVTMTAYCAVTIAAFVLCWGLSFPLDFAGIVSFCAMSVVSGLCLGYALDDAH